MKTTELKQKLHQYIETADEKKLEAIYTIVEDDIPGYDRWNDKDFIAEMNNRMSELKSGKVKAYTWGQVKARATKKLKLAKNNK